jgi:L-lactate dehydrogenase
MKLGIIGTGNVGNAIALAAVTRGSAREIVLVNRTRKVAKAVATDLRYGIPLGPRIDISDGDYDALNGACVVLITSGVDEKTGGATDRSDTQGRLRLLEKNAAIYRDIVPKIISAAPQAVLVAVTDPPDPLADVARIIGGHDRVISTGTFLDSLRFRVHLGAHFDVDPVDVEAQVNWRPWHIAGVPVVLRAYCRCALGEAVAGAPRKPRGPARNGREHVRYANITIIEGHDASQYGIGVVSARIAEMVLRDERSAIPIGSYQREFGVTLSLPSVVGRRGVTAIFPPELSAEERDGLRKSAENLRTALERVRS